MKLIRTFFEYRFTPVVLLVLAGLLTYWQVLNGVFLLDDYSLIVNNESVHSLKNIGVWFTEDTLHGSQFSSIFYRPVSTFFFGLVYSMFGENPFGFHLLNLVVHLVNSMLVFGIFHKIFTGGLGRLVSFLMALVFVVHPMNTEAVSYISGLPDILMPLFSLLAIYLFLKKGRAKNSRISWVRIGFVSLLFVLALLSKESAVVLVPLIATITIYQWNTYSKRDTTQALSLIIGMLMIVGLYVLLRTEILELSIAGLSVKDNAYTDSVIVRLITFVSNLFEYFRIMFFPVDLHFFKEYEFTTSLSGARGLGGLVVIIVGIFLSGYLCFQKYSAGKNHGVFALGFSWFFIAFIPAMGFIPLNMLYAERWLYLPAIGILLILAYGINLLWQWKKQLVIPTVVLVLAAVTVLGMRTFERNVNWQSLFGFYEHELIYNPNSPQIHNELGVAYFEQANYEKAVEHYQTALNTMPELSYAHFNLANSYMNLGETEKAINAYYTSIKLNPKLKSSYVALFQIYHYIIQDTEKAEQIRSIIERLETGEEVSFEEVKAVKVFER